MNVVSSPQDWNLSGSILTLADLPASPKLATNAPLRTLVLADTRHQTNAVRAYYEGFLDYSKNSVSIYNPTRRDGAPLPDLKHFDVIIIHYSICILFKVFLPERARRQIRRFPGVKIQIIQDEYRWINRMNAAIADLGIHVLVSSLRPQTIMKVYHHPGLAQTIKCSALPGYVDDGLVRMKAPRIAEREIDVVYRGRDDLQYWMGHFPRDKVDIARNFLELAANSNLNTDVNITDPARLYREDWNNFLMSARVALGTEGGASIFDFDGEVEAKVQDYMDRNPDAGFDDVADAVLGPYEGNIVHKTITPRCFEAIALRTALVLFPGEYRGVLEPWRHYIPLQRDFSNLQEVIEKIRDHAFLQDLVDRAFEEIALNAHYQLSTHIQRLDCLIDRVDRRLYDDCRSLRFPWNLVRSSPSTRLGSWHRRARRRFALPEGSQ